MSEDRYSVTETKLGALDSVVKEMKAEFKDALFQTHGRITKLGDKMEAQMRGYVQSVDGKLEQVNEKIDKLANRVPPWMVVVTSTLTMVLGWFARVVFDGGQ